MSWHIFHFARPRLISINVSFNNDEIFTLWEITLIFMVMGLFVFSNFLICDLRTFKRYCFNYNIAIFTATGWRYSEWRGSEGRQGQTEGHWRGQGQQGAPTDLEKQIREEEKADGWGDSRRTAYVIPVTPPHLFSLTRVWYSKNFRFLSTWLLSVSQRVHCVDIGRV